MPAWPTIVLDPISEMISLLHSGRAVSNYLNSLNSLNINLNELTMPAGYSSRCKSCNSPNRLKIEEWHSKDGLSDRAIQARLKSEFGEDISYVAISNHFSEHYNVQAEVQEQYNQSQVNLQKDAGERVSEIRVLDDIVESKHKLHQMLEKIFSSRLASLLEGAEKGEEPPELPKLPMAYVSLYTGCAAGICQALKAKQELLGEDSGKKKADAMQSWVDLMLEDE
jgi:hypothetical protein